MIKTASKLSYIAIRIDRPTLSLHVRVDLRWIVGAALAAARLYIYLNPRTC